MTLPLRSATVDSPQTRSPGLWLNSGFFGLLLPFGLLLILTISLQWASGALTSEFSSGDESAHYVTGQMIREYIVRGLGSNPLTFAKNYYMHYPQVAFGMWPPLLHFVESVWTLLFTPSRFSMTCLMAVITALLSVSVYRTAVPLFGSLASFALAVLLILLPDVQISTGLIMADNLVALLDFWAALCFARFLLRERRRDVLLFGLWAALSMSTKSNALALLIFPFLAILLSRKLYLLKRLDFWLSMAMALCIAGPWEYYSWKLVSGTVEMIPFDARVGLTHAWDYLVALEMIFGPLLSISILIGLWSALRRAQTDSSRVLFSSSAALILAVWMFHTLVPKAGGAVGARYMLGAVAPALLFLGEGVSFLASLTFPGRLSKAGKGLVVASALAISFFALTFKVPPKPYYGFSELASRLVARRDFRDAIFLISSEGRGENMLVSEIALRKPHPECFILRASKVLSRSNWDGNHYELAYNTPDEIMAYLDSVPVTYLVIDRTAARFSEPHHRLLQQAIHQYPKRFQKLDLDSASTSPTNRRTDPTAIDLYYVLGQKPLTGRQINVDMRYTLGGRITGAE